jgi:hypothetical protein
MEAQMFFLPKGNSLFENLDAAKLMLPDVLTKLRSAGFSGYVSFLFPAATINMTLETGKLGGLLLEEQGGVRRTDREALAELSDLMLSTKEGVMSVYTLSPRLCACIRALLRGTVVYGAQELKLLNIAGLLQQISSERITGCLRTYTDDRSSLIFYRDGSPLGFFHDGSSDLETVANESQRIASLSGAKIDLYSTPAMPEPLETDLLEIVDIRDVWNNAVARQQNAGTVPA